MPDPSAGSPASPAGPGSGPVETERLFREHAGFVASFLRHMGANEAELDDMVQDVFVIAHRKGGYQPGAAAPRTWLASLARRVTLARRRSRARRPVPAELPETLADAGRDQGQTLDDQRAMARVQEALGQLSDKHREVFVLFELDELPCEDIAGIVGVSTGTVYSRLHHARKQFQKAYRGLSQRAQLAARGGET